MPLKYFNNYINKKNSIGDIPVRNKKPTQSENPFVRNYKPIRLGYYPKEFYEIRPEVIKRFEDKCFLCGEIANEIHHIDYDKMNNSIDNLMLLCSSCHGKTNYDRDYWKDYLRGKMISFFCVYKKEVE